MTVLVTGATGFVGRGLVPALVAAGHRVRAAAPDAHRIAANDVIEPVLLPDLATPFDWRPLLDGVTHVVHLAGIAHAMGGLPDTLYDRVNRDATTALARTAATAGIDLVLVSSVRAQTGPTSTRIIRESDTPQPTDAYGRSKLAAEDAIRAAAGRFAILRPVLVYGPGVGGNLATLARLAARPWPLPFGSFANQRSLLARTTLCAAITWALISPAASGGTFLVADRTPLSFAELLIAMRAAIGRPPGLLPLPSSLMLGALRLAGRREIADRLGGGLVVSTAKLAAAGFIWPTATSDLTEMMRDYAPPAVG